MAEEPQYHDMHGKLLFDILSKLPSKSLLRFRCVSKLWREYIDDSYFVSVHDKQVIEDPTPIVFYLNELGLTKPLCFHSTVDSDTISNQVLKVKNNPLFEFVDKKLLSEKSITYFVGSCNGLVIIETEDPEADDDLMLTFTVIHPTNKQYYVLPQLPSNFMFEVPCDQESCGLGFDSSTNTFKMVCVYLNPNYPDCEASSAHCTMVHVFGTNSWREIPKVPSNRVSGKAIFAHGCLHWMERYNGKDVARLVIWFDVKNEEFGLIKPPKTVSKPSKRKLNDSFCDDLVNLDGQVGYFSDETTEVWVLNHKKEWMLHCDFSYKLDSYSGWNREVLGCLNKAGDILIRVSRLATLGRAEFYYIYNLKNKVIHNARIDDDSGLNFDDDSRTHIVMFPNSLLDIITNSNLFKRRA